MTRELVRLHEGRALAQYGPMRLVISAATRKGADSSLALEAGKFAFTLLPRLAPSLELFRANSKGRTQFDGLVYDEPLFNKMIAAVKSVNQDELGPMAAVAGVVADAVAIFLKDNGAVKAVVENGGDVAVALAPGYRANVGISLGLKTAGPSYKMTLNGDIRPFWGICSSGFGGRGLTRGIADAAMCVASSAAVADAAATALGNACRVNSTAVKMVPAENIHPETDIRGIMVTEFVGELAEYEIEEAVARAASFAGELVERDVLLGALVSLKNKMVLTESFDEKAAPIEFI